MAFPRQLVFVAWFAVTAAMAQTTTELFDDSVLHEIRISMPAANWQALKDHYLDNTYYNVDSLQWKGGGSNTLTVNNLTVRSRGHGGFAQLLLGSVSQQCAHHSECPVVIVHAKRKRE